MARVLSMVVGVVVVATSVVPAGAAVLCSKKKGTVSAREACKTKETALDLADFGLLGPKGDKGDKGDQGDPGDAFSAASTLQTGQTLTGPWAVGGGTSDWAGTSVQFRLPLAAAIAGANTHYLGVGAPPTAECPGFGQAAAGHLCVYTNEGTSGTLTFSAIYHNEGDLTASVAGAGRFGFHIFFSGSGTLSYLSGSYTVTAP